MKVATAPATHAKMHYSSLSQRISALSDGSVLCWYRGTLLVIGHIPSIVMNNAFICPTPL